MVLDQITLEKGIAQVTVDQPKSIKEIEEEKTMTRQIEKQKRY